MNPQPLIEVPQQTFMFTTVGDLFIFIGLLVSIGSVGVYAVYRIWMDFFGD